MPLNTHVTGAGVTGREGHNQHLHIAFCILQFGLQVVSVSRCSLTIQGADSTVASIGGLLWPICLYPGGAWAILTIPLPCSAASITSHLVIVTFVNSSRKLSAA